MRSSSLGIVLINYFNDEEVISFIRLQLFRQAGMQFEIYVLNNGSKGNELKSFCEKTAGIRYFDPGKNLGYIGGFLFVYEQIPKPGPDILILSNTDIEIDDPSLMAGISVYPFSDSEVMLGPSVISTRTGHNQNPFYVRRISMMKLRLLSFIFSWYPAYFIYAGLGVLKAILRRNGSGEETQMKSFVYAIHGSFMVFKSVFLQSYLNELKDAPYLFGEEIQFAEVACRHNLKIVFVPEFRIRHHEHATTRLFKSRKMLRLLKDSIDFSLGKRRAAEKNHQSV